MPWCGGVLLSFEDDKRNNVLRQYVSEIALVHSEFVYLTSSICLLKRRSDDTAIEGARGISNVEQGLCARLVKTAGRAPMTLLTRRKAYDGVYSRS